MRSGATAEEEIEDILAVLEELNGIVQAYAAQVFLDEPCVPGVIFGDDYHYLFCHDQRLDLVGIAGKLTKKVLP
jgi:hypothetical protein